MFVFIDCYICIQMLMYICIITCPDESIWYGSYMHIFSINCVGFRAYQEAWRGLSLFLSETITCPQHLTWGWGLLHPHWQVSWYCVVKVLFGSHIAEISWAHFPCHIEEMLSHSEELISLTLNNLTCLCVFVWKCAGLCRCCGKKKLQDLLQVEL